MRTELGFAAMTLGLWAAGAAVLLASGIVRFGMRSLLVWSGAAYVVGLSLVGVLLTAAAYAGVRASTKLTAVVIVAVVVAAVVTWRLIRSRIAPAPATGFPADRGFLIAGGAVAGIFLFAGTALALVNPIQEWDGWAIWGLKAALLYDDGTVPELLATGGYGLSQIDYPLLWPVLEATHQRAMGGVEPKLASLPHWVLYVAFAWTLAAVASRLMRPAFWVPLAVGTLTTYAIVDQLFWHYADVPTAIIVGAAVLFGAMWLEGLGVRWLVPTAIALGAAANGKNEGLMAIAAVLAALLVAGLARGYGRRAVLPLVPVTAVIGLSVLPWRVWLTAHDVSGQITASDIVNPGLLADRADRIGPTASKLWDHISGGSWGLLAVATLVLVAAAVARRSSRAIGLYYTVALGSVFVLLVNAYVVTPDDYEWRLGTSANRVVQTLGFIGIAAVVHLTAILTRRAEDDIEFVDDGAPRGEAGSTLPR